MSKNQTLTFNIKKPSPKFLKSLAIILILIMSGSSLALSIYTWQKGNQPITINRSSDQDGNSANFTEGSIADVATKVSKNVVSILTETRTLGWFGQSSTSSAAGTGIIVSSDGYILTNKHVVSGANTINVVTDDGTTYKNVSVVAIDPLNDAAFLKIPDVKDLPAAKLGDSKTITVGQQVIAIGNALGQFQNTVTSGIVSGTGRSITATDSSYSSYETLTDLIQTDAAINAGNSGGPLVNAAGEVIGINTATTSDANNIGFAIPISSIKGMLSGVLKDGKASRSYVGVYSVSITPQIAEEYGLPVKSGAYIYSSARYSAIAADSPAEKAGIKEKDIVTAVNGDKIGINGSLTSLTGEYQPGDTIQLVIIRNGSEMTLNLTLGSYPEN